MIAIGIGIIMGIIMFLLGLAVEHNAIFGLIFGIIIGGLFIFLLSLTLVGLPPNPEEVELTIESITEIEVVEARGQYWIYKEDNFVDIFNKDLRSYVAYDNNKIDNIPEVYKIKCKKPNVWWLSFININDYTYYKIVLPKP